MKTNNFMTMIENALESKLDELFLTFYELRDKCLRHIQDAHQRCSCGQKFSNPDADWLRDEFLNIFGSLESNKAVYEYSDLVNAFYSVIFELEYGQKLYPNTLIKYGNNLYRIFSFYREYPIKVRMLRYKKHSNGQLAKREVRTYLERPVQRILLIDPLSRITHYL